MRSETGSKAHVPDAWSRIRFFENPIKPKRSGTNSIYLGHRRLSSRISGKLLQIGSGIGNPLASFHRAPGCELYGITDSLLDLNIAKRQSRENGFVFKELKVAAVPPIGYPDQFFDAVFHSVILRHDALDILEKIGDEIGRVLKPRGIFFCSLMSEKTMTPLRGTAIHEGGFENPELDGTMEFITRARELDVFRGFDFMQWDGLSRRGLSENRIVTGLFPILLLSR